MSLLLDALKKAALEKQKQADTSEPSVSIKKTERLNSNSDLAHAEQDLKQYENTKKSIEENLKKAEQISASVKANQSTHSNSVENQDKSSSDQQTITSTSTSGESLVVTPEESNTEIDISELDISLDPEQFITIEENDNSIELDADVKKELINEPEKKLAKESEELQTVNTYEHSFADTAIESEDIRGRLDKAGQASDINTEPKPDFIQNKQTDTLTAKNANQPLLDSNASEPKELDLESEAIFQKQAIKALIDQGNKAKKKQNLIRASVATVLIVLSVVGISAYAYLRLDPNSSQIIQTPELPISETDVYGLDNKTDIEISGAHHEIEGGVVKRSTLDMNESAISRPQSHGQSQITNIAPDRVNRVNLTEDTLKPFFPSIKNLPKQIVTISAAEIERHRLRNLGPRASTENVSNVQFTKPPREQSVRDTNNSIEHSSKPINSFRVEQNYSYYITAAYQAWSDRDWEKSRKLYDKALQQQPNSKDAILGAAVVATQLGNYQYALKLFQRRLERAPKDQYALTGILSLVDLSLANHSFESEVSNLLAEYPEAAHLHYIKGSLYANREQWEAAQEHFFIAWQKAPDQPDYLFNLAISMDQLGLYKEALAFYKEVDKAFNRVHSGINHNDLRNRITLLESHYQQ